ncbi:hypothetical protein [Pseudonocardia sp. GCM10023141]|uniref:hypothetical protein n=1 Tax=Pseudonocardia sp. GCM10023141 TaxID=3252653 RepID=UPI00361E7204
MPDTMSQTVTEEDMLDATTPASVEPEPAPVGRGGWLRRPHVLAVVAGFLVLAVVAGLALFNWRQESALTGARSAALDAGKRYALDLSTYDYRKIDDNFTLVSQNSSAAFAKQYKEVSDQLSGIIKQYQGVSEGTVVDAGVASGDTSRVDVVLFVDQKITNTQAKDPRVDRSRMKMSLVSDAGTWKIDSLTLL